MFGNLFQYYQSSHPLPCPVYEVTDEHIKKQYQVEKHWIDTIDDKVKRDMQQVELYLEPLRRVIPLYNDSLVEAAKAVIKEQFNEIEQNSKANTDLAKSKIRVRKRTDGSEQKITVSDLTV